LESEGGTELYSKASGSEDCETVGTGRDNGVGVGEWEEAIEGIHHGEINI
jgi:hypothetical protein